MVTGTRNPKKLIKIGLKEKSQPNIKYYTVKTPYIPDMLQVFALSAGR